MLKKYQSLNEFCKDNSYKVESLLTIDDKFYIGLHLKTHKWHVGSYSHSSNTYDVELSNIYRLSTMQEAVTLLFTFIKDLK